VSSALSTVQELEKRREDLKQRLAEVHRASRMRRPRSAEARPSALMAAVGTPRDAEDAYTLELTRELDETLPLLLEARQVLESLQQDRHKKLAQQSPPPLPPPPPPHVDIERMIVEGDTDPLASKSSSNPLVMEREVTYHMIKDNTMSFVARLFS
jgi:hypothetical protein